MIANAFEARPLPRASQSLVSSTDLDAGSSLTEATAQKKFRSRLRSWFRHSRRPLPWRSTQDPYRIWVSEIMLQQTRAAAVVPYYQKFLARFPNVRALASSREEDLLECWSGLGYYSRARNMRRAAQQILSEMDGRLPQTYARWASLPGVGPYTAAAVASIGFGVPVAVLDGNVARVIARLVTHSGDVGSQRVKEQLRQQSQQLLDKRHPGDFNQALMELGATVCLPRGALCHRCPVADWCQARRLGIQDELPVKAISQKPVGLRVFVAIVEREGKVLVRQRPSSLSLMPGFWEFPQVEGPELDRDCLAARHIRLETIAGHFSHSITYHKYSGSAFYGVLKGRRPVGFQWVEREKLGALPLTTITKKALEAMRSGNGLSVPGRRT